MLTPAELADEVQATIELFGQLTDLSKVDQDRNESNNESKGADQTQLPLQLFAYRRYVPAPNVINHVRVASKHATNSLDDQDFLLSPKMQMFTASKFFRIAKSVVRIEKGKCWVAVLNINDKPRLIPQFTIFAKLESILDNDQFISAHEIFGKKPTDRELEEKFCDIFHQNSASVACKISDAETNGILSQIKIDPKRSDGKKQRILNVLRSRVRVFPTKNRPIGRCKLYNMPWI